MRKIITHSGVFHADDVFSVALVKLIEPDVYKIVRTRNENVVRNGIFNDLTWVLDIGLVTDVKNRNFDHHQDSTMDSTILQMVKSLDLSNLTRADIEYEYLKSALIEKFKFISAFDINENGLHGKLCKYDDMTGFPIPNISTIIYAFNRDAEDDDRQNMQFDDAVKFAKQIIINWVNEIVDNFAGIKIFESRIVLDTVTSKVAIMDKYCTNWRELVRPTPVRYVIMPDPQGYSALTVSSEKFPINVDKNHDGLIFLHDSKFVAKFKTKESAIDAIKKL